MCKMKIFPALTQAWKDNKYFVLHRTEIIHLFSLKLPLQLEKLLTHTWEGTQLLSDRLFKKFDLWLPLHCWNLTFHVVSVRHTFFFHANFLVKTTNGHVIKGQPSFIFLFDKEISISSPAVRAVWECVTCQRNYWCIPSWSSSKFSHFPSFSSFQFNGCFNLNTFSLFNGILKLAVGGIWILLVTWGWVDGR